MIQPIDILAKNLLIRASAGSGKTYQLGNRVIGLIAHGAEPAHIVALTFTRKAAGEFTDSVLTKLAKACSSRDEANALRVATAAPALDPLAVLARLARALPRLDFGTMDGFFSRVVRCYPYELGLTSGHFELVQGPRAEALKDILLSEVLGTRLPDKDDPFFHAFLRATHGSEDIPVARDLRKFIDTWHAIYRKSADKSWGPDFLATTDPNEWEKHKHHLATHATTQLDGTDLPDAIDKSLAKLIEQLEEHTIGGGEVPEFKNTIGKQLLLALTEGKAEPTTLTYRKKDYTLSPALSKAIADLILHCAHCEISAAARRTRALHDVIASYEFTTAAKARQRGLLGFADIKHLMGEWARDEQSRLRREAVDFRLDSRIDHWLLDEFQDTSDDDWAGLKPLIDEAISREDATTFVVGDRKQAIYAWRGGDVRLFDKLLADYPGAITEQSMAESYRSCPEVLALVNRVCGDLRTMATLFGESPVSRWLWDNHTPAPALCQPEKRGHARVEILNDTEDRLPRLLEILEELQIGKQPLTCGILLRSNPHVSEVSDFLRAHGYDVSEEGERKPAADHPIGILAHHILRWLANPSDTYSRTTIALSPLAGAHPHVLAGDWPALWAELTARIAEAGFAATIEALLVPISRDYSAFGKRRLRDIIDALAALDASPTRSLADAADWLERLTINQSPSASAIQVMTIHKSKGLGFDIVILPRIPTTSIPDASHYHTASQPDWLSIAPPKWTRSLSAEHRAAEAAWAEDQCYEAFCTLYVALTRAKRGLHILLDPPPKTTSTEDRPTLTNWLRQTLDPPGDDGLIFAQGDPSWAKRYDRPSRDQKQILTPQLAPATIPHRPARPSGKATSTNAATAFGSEVHAILETIAWLGEGELPELANTPAGAFVSTLLATPAIRALFTQPTAETKLYREQAIVAKHSHGIIDRLHVHPSHIDLIDFKTDAEDDPESLISRHRAQLQAYRDAIAEIYPGKPIHTHILSTHLREIITL